MKRIVVDGLLVSLIVIFAHMLGLDLNTLILIILCGTAIITIRTLQELIMLFKDVSQGIAYLICLAMQEGKAQGNTAFRVMKTERGLVVERIEKNTEGES